MRCFRTHIIPHYSLLIFYVTYYCLYLKAKRTIKLVQLLGLLLLLLLLLLFITAFQICEVFIWVSRFLVLSSLNLPPLPADRSDFDVHGAIDNDHVWIHSICLPVSTVLFVVIVVIISFICIIVLEIIAFDLWVTVELHVHIHLSWNIVHIEFGLAVEHAISHGVDLCSSFLGSNEFAHEICVNISFLNLLLLGLLWLLLLLCR